MKESKLTIALADKEEIEGVFNPCLDISVEPMLWVKFKEAGYVDWRRYSNSEVITLP